MTTLVDKSIPLTDEVIDDLLNDWFDRDGETFIRKRTERRLGWEDRLTGTAYSEYILSSPTQEDLVRRAYSLARDTLVSMNHPYKVKVAITPTTNATDGKTVWVATKVFDDEVLSVADKLDVFLGATVHEGCHLLYTDMVLKDEELMVNRVKMLLYNVVEDERIEILCGEDNPGLANFLEKSKYYYFKMYADALPTEEKPDPFTTIFNLILHAVRYPSVLREEEVVEYGHYMIAIKKALFPYPTSSLEAVEVAKTLYGIIEEFIKIETPPKTDSPREGEGEKLSDADVMDAIARGFSKVYKGLSKALPETTSKEDSACEVVKRDAGLLGKEVEGSLDIGSTKDTIFAWAEENRSRYEEALRVVRPYIPAISKVLQTNYKDYKLLHRGMRSGTLDTNKLAEAIQGVPTVYTRIGEVKTERVGVCLLIDESGSMRGDRIKAARETAILLAEAFNRVPNVELYVYGHSADIYRYGMTELSIYQEGKKHVPYGLGSVTARCENRDGVAIIEVAKRVRRKFPDRVLMFVISDGAPSADYYRGHLAVEHTRECVNKATTMGFDIVQVCIAHKYDPKEMFDHYVILEDLATLAPKLGNVIKKATLKASKVNCS